ncbi:hypothetical protein ABEO98_21610 [Brevibacillus parabrevis]|uniref:hypothetical protein n=1 Tax=Brevibacillus parabrevis TaxID=54914 RepID=UPI002E1EA976|nr:hypothetical protein [Brevibacillus parabrevis]
MDTVFETAFKYIATLGVPIFCLTVIAVADQLIVLLKGALITAKAKGRRRYG